MSDLLQEILALREHELRVLELGPKVSLFLPVKGVSGVATQKVTLPTSQVLILLEPPHGSDGMIRRVPPPGRLMNLGDLTQEGVKDAQKARVVLLKRHNQTYMLVKNDFGPAPKLLGANIFLPHK